MLDQGQLTYFVLIVLTNIDFDPKFGVDIPDDIRADSLVFLPFDAVHLVVSAGDSFEFAFDSLPAADIAAVDSCVAIGIAAVAVAVGVVDMLAAAVDNRSGSLEFQILDVDSQDGILADSLVFLPPGVERLAVFDDLFGFVPVRTAVTVAVTAVAVLEEQFVDSLAGRLNSVDFAAVDGIRIAVVVGVGVVVVATDNFVDANSLQFEHFDNWELVMVGDILNQMDYSHCSDIDWDEEMVDD